MPELPEVETVRAGLERHVAGRTVATAAVLNPRAVRRDPAGPGGFAAALPGRTLLRAERRGKYLWLALDSGTGTALSAGRNGVPAAGPNGDFAVGADPDPSAAADEALLAHLGMSGQLLVGDPDRPLSPHVRARFTFTDGGPDLRFTDQRTFGQLMVVPLVSSAHLAASASPGRLSAHLATARLPSGGTDPRQPLAVRPDGIPPGGCGGRVVPAPVAHIAPDPLEADFDPDVFAARLTRRKTGVKRALLDQSLVSGIGNIYADEALWRARLHWARPTGTLKPREVSRLLEAVRAVLTEALKAGGTSFDALYVTVNGESGYFDRSLNAYGRAGEPCGRCGTPIRRDSFMNRSAYSCPRCQPRPRG